MNCRKKGKRHEAEGEKKKGGEGSSEYKGRGVRREA